MNGDCIRGQFQIFTAVQKILNGGHFRIFGIFVSSSFFSAKSRLALISNPTRSGHIWQFCKGVFPPWSVSVKDVLQRGPDTPPWQSALGGLHLLNLITEGSRKGVSPSSS